MIKLLREFVNGKIKISREELHKILSFFSSLTKMLYSIKHHRIDKNRIVLIVDFKLNCDDDVNPLEFNLTSFIECIKIVSSYYFDIERMLEYVDDVNVFLAMVQSFYDECGFSNKFGAEFLNDYAIKSNLSEKLDHIHKTLANLSMMDFRKNIRYNVIRTVFFLKDEETAKSLLEDINTLKWLIIGE